MHLLYCDETNLVERKGDFFVYGGLLHYGLQFIGAALDGGTQHSQMKRLVLL
jgi:hypothetical protein